MSANLAHKRLKEAEELNKPSWVNNIRHGHIDQVEWLITTDQAEAYAAAIPPTPLNDCIAGIRALPRLRLARHG